MPEPRGRQTAIRDQFIEAGNAHPGRACDIETHRLKGEDFEAQQGGAQVAFGCGGGHAFIVAPPSPAPPELGTPPETICP